MIFTTGQAKTVCSWWVQFEDFVCSLVVDSCSGEFILEIWIFKVVAWCQSMGPVYIRHIGDDDDDDSDDNGDHDDDGDDSDDGDDHDDDDDDDSDDNDSDDNNDHDDDSDDNNDHDDDSDDGDDHDDDDDSDEGDAQQDERLRVCLLCAQEGCGGDVDSFPDQLKLPETHPAPCDSNWPDHPDCSRQEQLNHQRLTAVLWRGEEKEWLGERQSCQETDPQCNDLPHHSSQQTSFSSSCGGVGANVLSFWE